MNWGCLSFIILFPVGILIWARGEMRRRAALPPDELKKLEDEESYGTINPTIGCIYCKQTGCVRARNIIHLEGGRALGFMHPDHPLNHLLGKKDLMGNMTLREFESGLVDYIKVHCTKCGNTWEMFPPENPSKS